MRARGLLLAVLALAAGCDAWLTKPSLYNSVTVVVMSRNGTPVPNANLALYTGQRPMGYAATAADGRFIFQDVPQGNYGVIITPPSGYDVIEHLIHAPPSTYKDNLNVADDTLSPVRFTLLKRGPGSVTVHVAETGVGDIAGVPVTLYSPTDLLGKATTNSTGRVSFPSVPFGVYGVVIERPPLFRDYVQPRDSVSSYQDDIVIDDGFSDTTSFFMRRCAGTMRAVLVDDSGAPVPATTVLFYSSDGQLSVGASGPSGIVQFSAAPCAVQLGMYITPGPGYTVPDGRGFRFIDGLTLTNGGNVQATFHLHKGP
ncbi:MAG: MSCRAMM family protein [Gemmatimonadaceae bacterium]